jgi:hypothetical protein
MNLKLIIHILRNPAGHTEADQREARLAAADLLEKYDKLKPKMVELGEWLIEEGSKA